MPRHDPAGNMTCAPRPGDEATAAEALVSVYDAWNRPVRVYKDTNANGVPDDGTDTLLAEYRYDGHHRRIAKIVPDPVHEGKWKRTDYYYTLAWQVFEERTADNLDSKDTLATAVKAQYLWDVRYIDAPVVRWYDLTGDGDFQDENEVLYYANDANMNVTALVNTSGTVVERYQYDPYGKVTFLKADWTLQEVEGHDDGTSSLFANEILYCGYRWESETGLYHVRHRYYHPTLGRWLSRDPIGYADGGNLNQYGGGNPAGGSDPHGANWWKRLWTANEVCKHTGENEVREEPYEKVLSSDWVERVFTPTRIRMIRFRCMCRIWCCDYDLQRGVHGSLVLWPDLDNQWEEWEQVDERSVPASYEDFRRDWIWGSETGGAYVFDKIGEGMRTAPPTQTNPITGEPRHNFGVDGPLEAMDRGTWQALGAMVGRFVGEAHLVSEQAWVAAEAEEGARFWRKCADTCQSKRQGWPVEMMLTPDGTGYREIQVKPRPKGE